MAGFFGLFDFTKEGKGVNKDEPKKKAFFLFWDIYFRKFWQLCRLNAIYLLCCLPIVTIGPATAGFAYVLRNYSREEHAFVFADFKSAALKNFKQAFPVGLVQLFGTVILLFNFWFFLSGGEFMGSPLLGGVCLGLTALLLLAFTWLHFYIYTMIVTFDFSFKQLYKNSVLLVFGGFFHNLAASAGALFAWALFGLSLFAISYFLIFIFLCLALLLFFVFSFSGIAITFCTYPLIKKNIIDPYYKDHPMPQSEGYGYFDGSPD